MSGHNGFTSWIDSKAEYVIRKKCGSRKFKILNTFFTSNGVPNGDDFNIRTEGSIPYDDNHRNRCSMYEKAEAKRRKKEDILREEEIKKRSRQRSVKVSTKKVIDDYEDNSYPWNWRLSIYFEDDSAEIEIKLKKFRVGFSDYEFPNKISSTTSPGYTQTSIYAKKDDDGKFVLSKSRQLVDEFINQNKKQVEELDEEIKDLQKKKKALEKVGLAKKEIIKKIRQIK